MAPFKSNMKKMFASNRWLPYSGWDLSALGSYVDNTDTVWPRCSSKVKNLIFQTMHSIYKGYINRITSLTACQHLDIKRPLVCLLSSSHGDYKDSCVTHVENTLSDIIAHNGVTLMSPASGDRNVSKKRHGDNCLHTFAFHGKTVSMLLVKPFLLISLIWNKSAPHVFRYLIWSQHGASYWNDTFLFSTDLPALLLVFAPV